MQQRIAHYAVFHSINATYYSGHRLFTCLHITKLIRGFTMSHKTLSKKNGLKKTVATVALGALFTLSNVAHAGMLKLDVYNPGEKSIFPVSSEIISGNKEVVLIDAQFQKNDAQELVKQIKATGKDLSTIYISHSDPDFYFGLDVITRAFPHAKVIATQQTIDAINESQAGKLAYWGPVLKENAPQKVIVPQLLQGDHFLLEGEEIIVKGLNSAAPDRTFVWVPKLKAAMGGVLVSDNIHVWIADTQTQQSRQNWLTSLKEMQALNPNTVIPGHFVGKSKMDNTTITFTANYLKTFDAALPKAKDSESLIAEMKKTYPQLEDLSSLELSAKVLKGEMKWPQ